MTPDATQEFLKYQRGVLLIALGLIVVAVAGTYIGMPSDSRWAAGLALGGAAGLIKLRLDALGILRLADSPDAAAKIQLKSSLRSYVLLAAVLVIAFTFRQTFQPITAFIGLMLPRLVLIGDWFLRPSAATASASVASSGGDSHGA